MPPRKRICLITNRYPAYADDVASPFVRDFHLDLKRRGMEVSVFTPYYETAGDDWPEEVTRFRWAGGKKVVGALNPFNPRELLHILSFLKQGKRQLFEHLEKTRPDACLALWALPSGWFALQAKRRLGIPYSVWCLGSDIYVWARKPILKGLTRKVLQEADHLFADGFDLSQKVGELSGRNCAFLPSVRRLSSDKEQKQVMDSSKFNFLYLGRWDRKKGLNDLIRAFARMAGRIDSADLHVVGWGEFEDRMRRLIAELKLTNRVRIVGRVPTHLLAHHIRQADCLVIPSKSDSIPLVFSEALQMGTPLIVSDVGDMGKLVREFQLGKVFPAGDVEKLAEAMTEFVREKRDYSRKIPEALKLLNSDRAVDDYLKAMDTTRHSHTVAVSLSS
jgi:glycosyltransferase involved in cell wall biosynthesis